MLNSRFINFSIIRTYLKFILPSIIILLTAMFFIIYAVHFKSVALDKELYVNEIFNFCAADIDMAFNRYYLKAKYYNDKFNSYYIANDLHKRTFYNAFTWALAMQNTSTEALWATFDENKFDSLDAQYVNTEYYSEKGTFNICWCRNNDRKKTLHFQKYSSKQQQILSTSPCIELPKKTKQHILTKPTILSNTRNIIFTFSLPVFDKDSNVIGVTGLDIDIEDIVNSLNKHKISLIKKITLCSNKGTYFYHSDSNLIGKNIVSNKNYNSINIDSVLKKFAKNEPVILNDIIDYNDGTTMVYYYPIKIDGIPNTNLYVGVDLDTNYIAFDGSAFIISVLQYSMILLMLCCIIIIIVSICLEDIYSNQITAKVNKLQFNKEENSIENAHKN